VLAQKVGWIVGVHHGRPDTKPNIGFCQDFV
jgi:hypothetical protein